MRRWSPPASSCSATGSGSPEVSVLLPVRDAGEALSACLTSLAAQSLADHEVIAVDDGSSDESGERLSRTRPSTPGCACCARRPAASPPPSTWRFARRARRSSRAWTRTTWRTPTGCGSSPSGSPATPTSTCWAAASRPARLRAGQGRGHAGLRRVGERPRRPRRHGARPLRRIADRAPLRGDANPGAARARGLSRLRRARGLRAVAACVRRRSALRQAPRGPARVARLPGRLTRTDSRYAASAFVRLKVAALARGALAARPAVVWGAGPIGKAFARALIAAGQRVAAFVEVDARKIGQRIHGSPVLALGEAALIRGALHLGAVGQKGARERIRAEAAQLGLVDGPGLLRRRVSEHTGPARPARARAAARYNRRDDAGTNEPGARLRHPRWRWCSPWRPWRRPRRKPLLRLGLRPASRRWPASSSSRTAASPAPPSSTACCATRTGAFAGGRRSPRAGSAAPRLCRRCQTS